MASIFRSNVVSYTKHLRRDTLYRFISSTRRLMSQEWQQEGIAGSNLPFHIKNKYLWTLQCVVFFASGFNAPFLIMVRKFKLDNPGGSSGGPSQSQTREQNLTTVYCSEE